MYIECHCKNIKITPGYVPKELTSCNCSICRMVHSLWGYYHPDQVDVEIGGSGFTGYLWNDKCIEFVHCNKCGCVTHYITELGDPSPRIAINFRMADVDDIKGIQIRHHNGSDL